MPKKTGGSSKSAKTKRKIRKKKRDKFVTGALMISGAAVLLIVAANFAGIGSDRRDSLPNEPISDPMLSDTDITAYEQYGDSDRVCRFDFIDVGQGDSALITTPDGKFILIDAGTAASSDMLIRHLNASGVEEIEYFVISHPHNDHIGGAREVLEKYDVNHIIMSDAVSNTAQFEKLYNSILLEKEDGCKVYSAKPGDRYTVNDCIMDIIGPVEKDEENLNNSSVALTFTYGSFDAIFPGDSEKKAEELIISTGADIDCELYKVSHHGSDTSSSEAFINSVSPEVSVISCGRDNSHGHPNTEIVQRLYNSGSAVYVTSELGTVSVVTDGDGYAVYAKE